MCVAIVQIMPNQKNGNNDNKNDMSQDPQRQRAGQQGGGANKQPQRGPQQGGNRDIQDRGNKLPPDKTMPEDEGLDVEVGDDRSPQRAPQAGPGKPDLDR
jgi:hypothetical protein